MFNFTLSVVYNPKVELVEISQEFQDDLTDNISTLVRAEQAERSWHICINRKVWKIQNHVKEDKMKLKIEK